MKKLIVGVIAASATVFAFAAFAGTGSVTCTEKSPGSCSGKGEAIFWNDVVGSCYSLKASCKGDYVGKTWYANLSNVGQNVTLATMTDPECSAAASDSTAVVTDLKASCKTAGDVSLCGKTSAKASLKMRPDLCPYSCVKPDKTLGCP